MFCRISAHVPPHFRTYPPHSAHRCRSRRREQTHHRIKELPASCPGIGRGSGTRVRPRSGAGTRLTMSSRLLPSLLVCGPPTSSIEWPARPHQDRVVDGGTATPSIRCGGQRARQPQHLGAVTLTGEVAEQPGVGVGPDADESGRTRLGGSRTAWRTTRPCPTTPRMRGRITEWIAEQLLRTGRGYSRVQGQGLGPHAVLNTRMQILHTSRSRASGRLVALGGYHPRPLPEHEVGVPRRVIGHHRPVAQERGPDANLLRLPVHVR